MAKRIIMPKQGLQMTEGTIIKWLVKEGDTVKEGEPLFEMETDKLTISIDSTESGTLMKIVHPEGDVVPITEMIAIVGEPNEDITSLMGSSEENSEAGAEISQVINDLKKIGFDYKVVVIGGGPGGYEAAIRCAQYGLKTALVEKIELGGTCLNRGCIPTKALLHGAELFESITQAQDFGISAENVDINYAKLVAKKDSYVKKLRKGIERLEKANGVNYISGFGVLLDAHTVQVEDKKLTAEKIILATGSAPSLPPIPGIKDESIMTSDELLALTEIPESLVIIGGGVIGLEMATLFSALKCKVTIIEMLPRLLPDIDNEIVSQLINTLKNKNVNIITGAKVTAIHGGKSVNVEYECNGAVKSAIADKCVVSIGRSPQTNEIGLEKAGVEVERGFVKTDSKMATSAENIFAIGDITGKIQLAHVATAQAMVAAANCADMEEKMEYDIVPKCIYTSPEIAYIGINEEKARENGRKARTGTFNVAANGRAMVMGQASGIVKLVGDVVTGQILGAQIMAPRATDMIGEVAVAMACEGTIDELAKTIHAHPTISEIIMEAAHDFDGLCCNAMPKKEYI